MSASNWTTYVACSLCNARTKSFPEDDAGSGGALAEQEAAGLGFVRIGEVATAQRRRHLEWVCAECAKDVWHAAAAKVMEDILAMQARGGMPCAHTIGDLIGGKDSVTACGACLAEKQKAREEAAKPLPCSRCKERSAAFGDLCSECDVYDFGDPAEIAQLEAKKAARAGGES